MIFGHALPMPVVIETRKYDDAFYATVRSWGGDPVALEAHRVANAREYHEIFGSNDDGD